MTNAFLLLAEAALYFTVMAALFRARKRLGVGVFMCALAVMHFLETYLASVFYVAVPFGMLSPGSTVLFSGKLAMLLLLYIKEDAATVRQPIYGLLLGNVLMIGLVVLLRFHDIAGLPSGAVPDMTFVDGMGWLMVWGTALLFVDAILIILLYEKLGRWMGRAPFPRIALSVAAILTFDQLGFWTALHLLTGAPVDVLVGGWLGKMVAALVYSSLLAAYLRWFERNGEKTPRGIADVFDTLTFRERYEALIEHAGRDALTGLLHRGRFDEIGAKAVAESIRAGSALTLLVIDVDHFKSINDRYGHSVGDKVLKTIAATLLRTASTDDTAFRIGGEEFAIICARPHALGRLLGEAIRQAVGAAGGTDAPRCTVSIGVATVDAQTRGLADLFALADRRLYLAKEGGRNRVTGENAGDELRIGKKSRA